jgi:hypothetical protein
MLRQVITSWMHQAYGGRRWIVRRMEIPFKSVAGWTAIDQIVQIGAGLGLVDAAVTASFALPLASGGTALLFGH